MAVTAEIKTGSRAVDYLSSLVIATPSRSCDHLTTGFTYFCSKSAGRYNQDRLT